MITFYESCQRAAKAPMDEAVLALEGLMELSQHHPALAPEIAILRRLCATWWALIPGSGTRRLASFELWLDRLREKLPENALASLAQISDAYANEADLASERERIAVLREAWSDLQASDVIVRGRTN